MDSQSIWDDWGSPELGKPLKSSGYNSVKMAQYFQNLLNSSDWYRGLGINTRALSGQLARWKKSGLTADELTAMFNYYVDNASARGNSPGWQDFIYQRDNLLAKVTKPVDVTVEDDYDSAEDAFDEEQAMRDYLARRNK